MAHVRHTFSPFPYAGALDWKAMLEKAALLAKIIDENFGVALPESLTLSDRTPSDALFQYQTTNGVAVIRDASGYGFELFSATASDGSAQYTIDVQGVAENAFVFLKFAVGADGKIVAEASSVKVKCEAERLPALEAALK